MPRKHYNQYNQLKKQRLLTKKETFFLISERGGDFLASGGGVAKISSGGGGGGILRLRGKGRILGLRGGNRQCAVSHMCAWDPFSGLTDTCFISQHPNLCFTGIIINSKLKMMETQHKVQTSILPHNFATEKLHSRTFQYATTFK